MEVVEMSADESVKKFVGDYKPERYLLDIKRPFTLGAIDLQDYYFEHRLQLADAMRNSKPIILDVAKDFEKTFGRKYDFYEKYRMEDAETAIVIIGSAAGTAKVLVDNMRSQGKKVGLIKIRVYRPFPHEEIAKDLANLKAVAVMDRSDSCNGAFAPLYTDITSALFAHLGNKAPKTINYIYGLGGRDIDLSHFETVFKKLDELKNGAQAAKGPEYLNVRA